MKRARLIMNPVSGGEKPNPMKLPEIVAALEAANIRADLTFTAPDQSPTQIARQAVEEGYEMIVVSGGDGTVSEVAKGLIYASVPLGIIPIGTYNNIARSLDLPTDLKAACQVLAQGHVKSIDVGQANNEHYFFEVAGVGLDAALFPFGEAIKGGQWERFLQAAQLAMTYKPQQIRIMLDRPILQAKVQSESRLPFLRRSMLTKTRSRRELRFSVLLVVIANSPYYGAGFTVAPDACMDDGLLTVSVFRGFSKWQLLRHFWAISKGKYHYSPKIETYHVAELQVTAPHTHMPVHVDGHRIGELPVTFKVLQRALNVLVPVG
ncbi:MAG: diacylglycerol kinase family lipid kinase [Cyanobacteria bacterium RM1_2_2]|nr:diacylglycerol kinase family lipid kinase [Cyanobacteria bacterium RM1_2_2]